MKIVTWNVNSIKVRAELVGHFLDEEAPDVLCLQELKNPQDKVPIEIFEERGYHVAMHAQQRWNGVLIASKLPLDDVHTGLGEAEEGQARLIAARTGGVNIVNLYCPQGQDAESPKFAYKLRFFEALHTWLAERYTADDPLVVLGDLNIARSATDIFSVDYFEGKPSYHPLEHEAWDKLLALGLTDAVKPHIEPNTYSFWDYRGGAFRFNRGMRIDHFLVTPPVMARVASAQVLRPWRKKRGDLKASDHAPVEIVLGD